MAEEFVNIMKAFNERSIEDKLTVITNTLEKTIRYFTFRIEQLENSLKMIEIKYLLNQKKKESKVIIKENVLPPIQVKTYKREPISSLEARDNIKRELKEMFERKGKINEK